MTETEWDVSEFPRPALLRATLGDVLLGNNVATSGQTLATIAVLRDALEYLEGRYARQLGREKQAREQPPQAAPASKKAARKEAATPGARRGRPRRANGTAPEPAGLPFTAGEPPADAAAP